MIVVAVGLIALAGRGASTQVIVALCLAATIGVYSVLDAKGIRSVDTPLYAAATFVCRHDRRRRTYALATGRASEMVVGDAQLLAAIHC